MDQGRSYTTADLHDAELRSIQEMLRENHPDLLEEALRIAAIKLQMEADYNATMLQVKRAVGERRFPDARDMILRDAKTYKPASLGKVAPVPQALGEKRPVGAEDGEHLDVTSVKSGKRK